ncbi:MAG: hypothetical protein N3G22_02950 [Candidatus Micrarchaeota archaeon]|nr:hypothetical protein [Candidatus Micrarchaeota archaeon]
MRLAAAIMLLVAFLQPASASPKVWEAAGHNIEIAGLLLGKNACGFEERQPTEGDMFSHAGIKIVSLIPQVDNITSDLAAPSLLWSWSADAPRQMTFPLTGTTNCPGGEVQLTRIGKVSLEGARAFYRYGNSSKEAALFEDGPNPLALNLTGIGQQADPLQLRVPLNISLSANATANYSFYRKEYYYKCERRQNFTVCYCETRITTGKKKYSKGLHDERTFLVEVGPVSEMWLNPPLASRLAGEQKARLLLFARRMPAKLAASVGGSEIASAEPYSFEAKNGSCGEKIVKSAWSPSGFNLAVAVGNETAFPYQLVLKNATYLPFYLEFNWSESPGKKGLVLEYEDWFSHKERFGRNFSVRAPLPFSKNGTSSLALEIRQADEGRSPAAYPTESLGGWLASFEPISALLAAAVALGSIGLLRRMQKIAA